MQAEVLTGGDCRLRAGDASFLIHRARAGVITVVASGADRGQLGAAVVDELTAELQRFPIRAELFIDAAGVREVDLQAREVWTAWLRQHRARLQTVHMLVETTAMGLIADIARHYSGANLIVYRSPRAFDEALRRHNGSRPGLPAAAAAAGTATILQQRSAHGTSLTDGACRCAVRSPCDGVVVLSISGSDHGTLASSIFDEIRTYFRPGMPLRMFIDLREAAMPAAGVSELWADWFTANRHHLAAVRILGTTRAVWVTAGIASWRSRTGALIHIDADPDSFERALQQLVDERRR